MLRTTAAYLDVLRAETDLELTLHELESLTEQGAAAKQMLTYGEGTMTELLEVEARIDILKANLAELRSELSSRRTTLKNVIGVDPGHLAQLSNVACFANDIPKLEKWRVKMLEHNAEILAARSAVKIAEIELQKSRAARAPRAELVVNLSRADSDSITTFDQSNFNNFVGVVVNIPLYQGGSAVSASRQAVAGLERAKALLDHTVNLAYSRPEKAYSVLSSGKEKFEALNKAISSSNELIDATKGGIQGGVRVNLDLLDGATANATQQLFLAQRDLADARYVFVASWLQFRAVAGSLGYNDIDEVSLCFADK